MGRKPFRGSSSGPSSHSAPGGFLCLCFGERSEAIDAEAHDSSPISGQATPARKGRWNRIGRGKYLANYLRHAPHELGPELQPGGWVRVDDLRFAAEKKGIAQVRAFKPAIRGLWLPWRRIISQRAKLAATIVASGVRLVASGVRLGFWFK
jgi:hypothetical protein